MNNLRNAIKNIPINIDSFSSNKYAKCVMLGNFNFFNYSPESINFFSNAPVILMVSLTIRKDNHTDYFCKKYYEN